MKIYDCTTFYNEHMMYDIRLNILNEKVEKFIVTESIYSHSGQPKKLNFDINNYKKFKDKIIYIVIDHEPDDIEEVKGNKIDESYKKRLNSLKRIELSYNYMSNAIKDALDDDLIILSDNDEIPNLNSSIFLNSKKNIFIFKQLLFYYKFNLHYDLIPWFGSKACKKKQLISFSWLRNIKSRKYPIWRLDTCFSKTKYNNIEIIKNGGWHFTNIKTPEEIYKKLSNFGHHNEFELSGLDITKIEKFIKEKKVFYNHFVDKSNPYKWENSYKLKKVEHNKLPKFLIENKESFNQWFDD